MKIPQNLKWKATGRTLGAGGQATVVEVVDESLPDGSRYALKGLSNDKPKQAYDRFYREIEAIKKVDHPFIVKIIDHSNVGDSFHYYVMELVEGAVSLRRLLESGTSPFTGDALKSLRLFHKVLEVIEVCWSNKIVHRDLSPANILVVPDDSIRVIDFGICQIVDGESLTLIDEGVGTVNYMSPECEAGAEGDVSWKSDIYSAGKILWSLITGQRAFARESPILNAKAMMAMFPNKSETWHLRLFFDRTILEDPSDRWSTTNLLRISRRVQAAIERGFPPLEQTFKTCPTCGMGNLKPLLSEHPGYPVPKGMEWLQCDYCGFWSYLNTRMREKNLKPPSLFGHDAEKEFGEP